MSKRPDRHQAFREVLARLDQDEISDVDAAHKLLTEIVDKTEGWVIVDFLDAGNWDRLANVTIDTKSGKIELYWHDFRDGNKSDGMKMMLPADSYSAAMHFQSLRVLCDPIPAILMRGYALSEKDVKQFVANGVPKDKYEKLTANFFSQDVFINRDDETTEVIDVMTTPIYSVAIIPKMSGFSALDSKRLLFLHNIETAIDRAFELQSAIASAEDDASIRDLGNSLRRTYEFLLKIEVCYRDLPAKKGYGQLLLGDLTKLLKPFKNDDEKDMMTFLVRTTNDLSHDNGKPADKDSARLSCYYVVLYGRILSLEVGRNT